MEKKICTMSSFRFSCYIIYILSTKKEALFMQLDKLNVQREEQKKYFLMVGPIRGEGSGVKAEPLRKK